MATVMVMVMVTATPPRQSGAGQSTRCARDRSRPSCELSVVVAWILVFSSMSAIAQTSTDPGPRRAWSVVPRISATETFTDNADISGTTKQADLISQVSPGIRIQADTARLKAYVDYALNNFISANDSRRNRSQNALTSFGTFEAVEKWLFIDASGTVSQQTISAFGPQASGAANFNSNSTETSTYRLSPYIRGQLGGFADYNLRYSLSETRSNSALAANVSNEDLSGQLNGALAGPFGWGVNGNRQVVTYGTGLKSEVEKLAARLNYRYDAELSGFVSIGTESNNYSTLSKTSYSNSGYGVNWSPSERTTLAVSRERRSFGNSHSISFSHRTPLSAWRFTDSRSATVLPNQSGSTGLGTYYDLYFSQLASTVPDPIARAQQVNTLLQQAGIAPTAAITNGFLSSRLSLQRRQELALTLNGLRNTVTYTLFQADSQTLSDAAPGIGDDFSRTSLLKTRGMSSNFSHRLTPFTSLNALSSWNRNSGLAGGLASTQKVFNVTVSSRLSAKMNASLGVRSVISEGASAYRENAVLGTITAQF